MTWADGLAIHPVANDNLFMTIIGLIGRIGAGKSTVAQRFAMHGAHVIDADRIAHEVLEEGDVVQQIVDRFGVDMLDADGRIRRRAVADRVFGPTPDHARALEWLEALVRPRVRSRIEAQLAALLAREDGRDGDAIVVLDVPLLVQAGWADRCDRLVVVSCSKRFASNDWRRGTGVERSRRPEKPPGTGNMPLRGSRRKKCRPWMPRGIWLILSPRSTASGQDSPADWRRRLERGDSAGSVPWSW